MIKYIENPEIILQQGKNSKQIVYPYNPKTVSEVFIESINRCVNI